MDKSISLSEQSQINSNTLKSTKINRIISLLQWFLVVAAYGYLIYRLVTYDDWTLFATRFTSSGIKQYSYLVLAVMLLPLNIFLESLKWRYLLWQIEPMSIGQAQRQTYFGFIGAFLTPNRVGDYPVRVTMMKEKKHWLEAVALGFIGTLALSFTQVFLGLPSCILLLDKVGGFRWLEYICVAMLSMQIALIMFYPTICRKLAKSREDGRLKNTLVIMSQFSHRRFFITLFYSFLRYLTYCLQLWFVLSFCGINLTLANSLIAIPAYYLLVTVTPSIPIADAAVRGNWSVLIFSLFYADIAAIAVAAILLWILNTIIPMLIGTLIPRNKQS